MLRNILYKIVARFKSALFNLKIFISPNKRFIYTLNNGDRFYLCDDEISRSIYVYNDFENVNRAYWDGLIVPGMTVLDIGANWGVYSVAARRLMGVSGMLISFEPNLDEFNKLKDNIKLNKFNDQNVTLINSAVGDIKGEAKFYIPPSFKGAYGSMGRPKIEEDCKEVNVPVVTIDETLSDLDIRQVDVIKVDVEGAEIKVLQGMRRTLVERSPTVLMEVSDKRTNVFGYKANELCKFLMDIGYNLYLPVIKNKTISLESYKPQEHIKYIDIIAKKD